jgi:hypothetical protein
MKQAWSGTVFFGCPDFVSSWKRVPSRFCGVANFESANEGTK